MGDLIRFLDFSKDFFFVINHPLDFLFLFFLFMLVNNAVKIQLHIKGEYG